MMLHLLVCLFVFQGQIDIIFTVLATVIYLFLLNLPTQAFYKGSWLLSDTPATLELIKCLASLELYDILTFNWLPANRVI